MDIKYKKIEKMIDVIIILLSSLVACSATFEPEVFVNKRDEWTSAEIIKLTIEILIFTVIIVTSICAGYWCAIFFRKNFMRNTEFRQVRGQRMVEYYF